MAAVSSTGGTGEQRLPTLDGLRGIAILMVMIYHQTAIIGPTVVDRFMGFWTMGGWAGVDLFFVLSGFLITGILISAKGGEGYFRNFYARRILRIFPLYYAYIAFALLIVPHINHPKLANFAQIRGDDLWYWTYLSNVLIGIHHDFRHGFIDISWTLAIEEQFYVVWPLLVFLLSARTLMRLCAILIVGAIAFRLMLLLSGADPITVYVLTPGRLDSLAIGAFIAVASRSVGGVAFLRRAARPVLLVAGGSILLLAIVEGGFYEYTVPMQVLGYSLLALFFGSLLTMINQTSPGSRLARVIGWAPLRVFGKYSYALYLCHVPVRATLADTLYGPSQFLTLAGSPLPGLLIYYVISSGLALALAWISWHLYECHFLALKRFFVTQRRLAPGSAAVQVELPVAG